MNYSALVPCRGRLIRIWFDAVSEEDALSVAQACHGGLEGPSPAPAPEQLAVPIKKARELLGGVSRATIYNWLAVGQLDRVPGTSRVLITRSSIERAAAQR